MQSLDDLELEHESGGIDDESYAELHDDYTARAAAVIRTLRDGIDVTPAPPPRSRHGARRRVVLVERGAGVRGRGRDVARVRARRPPARSDRVGQLGGGTVHHERDRPALASDRGPPKQVNARPDDYDLRLQLARRVRGATADLADRDQAVGRRDHHRRERVPRRTRTPAGRSTSCPSRSSDKDDATATRSRRRSPGKTRRSGTVPSTPTRTTSARCCTRRAPAVRRITGRPAALHRARHPTVSGRQQRTRTARAGHVGARNAVDYGAPDDHDEEEEVIMAQPPAFEIDTDKIYRATITTDRGTIVADLDPKLAPNSVNHFVALVASGFLRRPHVPPGRARVRDPGWRPRGHRPWRSGLQVGRRAGARRVHARRAGHGERGPEHERLAVLHAPPPTAPATWPRATTSSATSCRAWTSRWRRRRAT